MINFNKGELLPSRYEGAESKIKILLNDTIYMVKFPDPVKQKKLALSYKSNQHSEYIGSHIFQLCGIEAQDTVLGLYTNKNGIKKLVVGCVDFTQNGGELYDFKYFADGAIDSEKRLTISIESVNYIIENSDFITDKDSVKNRFWDMFVVDSLIGNTDRHLGNWGLLLQNDQFRLAPVYDCGSSLSALVNEEDMEAILSDMNLFKENEYNIASVYRMNDQKLFYHEIFKNPPKELEEAMLRMFTKINMKEIESFISSVESLSELKKRYLIQSVQFRYNQILLPALKKIEQKEKESTKERIFNQEDDFDY